MGRKEQGEQIKAPGFRQQRQILNERTGNDDGSSTARRKEEESTITTDAILDTKIFSCSHLEWHSKKCKVQSMVEEG